MDAQRRRDLQQELTPAENQGLKACMSSSIWTHSLPMGVGSVALLRFIEMKTNYKPKMWAGLAMAVSGAVGGRLLAIPGCIRKVVAENPDGNLTKFLGELNSGKHRDRDSGFAPDTSDQILATDADTVSQPSVSHPPTMQAPAVESPSFNKQTYDDLRRRNREDYISKKKPSTATTPDQYVASPVDHSPYSAPYSDTPQPMSSFSDPPSPYMESLSRTPSSTIDEEPKVRRRKRVNIYGDEIED